MSNIVDHKGNPVSFQKAADPNPVFNEVASAKKDDMLSGYIGELRQMQDHVLNSLPQGLQEYDRLKTDDQVKSTFQQRRSAVISREWKVEAGGDSAADQAAADWLRETIEHVGWDRVVDKKMWGVFFGYSVAELFYAQDGQYVMLDEVRVRDRSRFRFDRNFQLRLLTPGDQSRGELMPERKFWVYSTGSTHDDDPYGMGLAHYLYWPVYFKRNGVKLWLGFLDAVMRGSPYGTYAPGTSETDQYKLLRALQILREGGAITFPEGMDVQTLDVSRGSTPDNAALYDKMNDAITKVVMSQTLTTDAASTGLNSSQGTEHGQVAKAVEKSDSDLIASSFRSGTSHFEGPLQWLTEWNFPNAEPPKVSYQFQEEEDKNTKAERDVKLSTVGYVPTEERIKEEYGEGYERSRQPRTAAGPDSELAFAEPVDELEEEEEERPVTDEYTEQALEENAFGGMVDQVEQLVEEVESLDELQDRLVDLYDEIDASDFERVMRKALVAAELAGRYEVAAEAEELEDE